VNSPLTVAKDTGTYADIFTVAGLAHLLASGTQKMVRIRDQGACFEVSVDNPDEVLSRVPAVAGYDYLQTKAEPVPVQQYVSYQVQKQRVARFAELRKAIRDKKMNGSDPAVLEQLQANLPLENWRQLQVLNALQGFRNSNGVYAQIARTDINSFRKTVTDGVAAICARRPSGVNWKTSSVQLFNPNAAKGYGLLKPSGTDRNNRTKEQWTDSFVEWLRYRGYFVTAAPFFMGSRGEHIRIFAPIPADISVSALRSLSSELRQAGLTGSAPRLDALAVLRLARLLIDHSEFGEVPPSEDIAVFLRNATPSSVISGLAVTHFQSLGQARAISEISTLALPGWFDIRSADDASAWRLILDEHRRVIMSLRDDHSDEMGLLIAYRGFLERRGRAALDAFVNFVGAYGAFLPGARERPGRRFASFATENFHRIVGGMMPDYLAILDDPGFRAVAAAIRRSTVSAQAMKALHQSDYREIRYELLHDIRRKRSLAGGAELLETIADFVAKYNYENARRREMRKRAPANVTTEEFEGLTRLIQDHGSALVGALLAAYGSCREPREPDLRSDDTVTDGTALDTDVADIDTEGED